MPDIFFKCEACEKNLVVDDAGVGLSVNCPDCSASIVIPQANQSEPLKRMPSLRRRRRSL
ncbi:MAG: hypothetical protein ABSA12_16810 [Verrucomicrobiia bacterium]|jgi:hypothetical protein